MNKQEKEIADRLLNRVLQAVEPPSVDGVIADRIHNYNTFLSCVRKRMDMEESVPFWKRFFACE